MTAARSNGGRWAVRIVVKGAAACVALAVASPAAALGDAPILTPSLQPQPPAATVAVPPPPVPTPVATSAPPPPPTAVTAPALPSAPATTPVTQAAPQTPTPSVQAPTAPVPPAPAVAAPSLPAAPKAVPQAPTLSVQAPTAPVPPAPAVAAPSLPAIPKAVPQAPTLSVQAPTAPVPPAPAVAAPSLPATPKAVQQAPTLSLPAPEVAVPSALALPAPSLPAAPIAASPLRQPTLEVPVALAMAVSASVESVAAARVSSTAASGDDTREAVARVASGMPALAIGSGDSAVSQAGEDRAAKPVLTTRQESRNDVATEPSADQQRPAAAPAPGPAPERQPPTAPQQLVAQPPLANAVSPAAPGRLAGAAAIPTPTGDASIILRSPVPLPSLPKMAGSEPLRQALPGRPAARAPQPVPPRPDGVAATTSTVSGGGAAALLLLVCLTSFLWTAPPLRRWLRRQHGLALTSALLAPLENPG